MEDEDRQPHFVQSLERGLAVIRTFGADRPEQTVSDVARATGLTRAAARRFLLTLTDLGYARTDGRLFALNPLVLELGYAYLSSLAVSEIAAPHLERLVAEVRESSSVSVLDGQEIVYVARVPTSRIMTVGISVGTRFPAHATSMGHVLLAGLPDDELKRYMAEAKRERFTSHTLIGEQDLHAELMGVRARGWALVDQELEEGIRSIAVPVHNRDGRVVAAVNISAHASRKSLQKMRRELLPPLQAAARAIEADLRTGGTKTHLGAGQ